MRRSNTKTDRSVLVGLLLVAIVLPGTTPPAFSQDTPDIVLPVGYKAEILATNPPGFVYNDITVSPTGELIVAVSAESRVPCHSYIASVSQDGAVNRWADICIDNPTSVAFGPHAGNLLFFSEAAGRYDYIFIVPPRGEPDDVALFAFNFIVPLDIALGPDGKLYVADIYYGAIYRVPARGGMREHFVDGFTSDTSGNPYPRALNLGLAFDGDGTLYIADAGAGAIYRVSPEGLVELFAPGLERPSALAFTPLGDLFVCDLVAGTVSSISPDGAATPLASGLKHPISLAVDKSGSLYVLEWESIEEIWTACRIIKISATAPE